MNDFICELDLDLDIKYLTELSINGHSFKNLPTHHRLVTGDSYLTQIRNKYPFLSGVFNVYKHAPGFILSPHIDANRFCALNIPICNTENSSTIFYDKDEHAELEYDSHRILHRVKSPVRECFRFSLSKPTLINTTYPHGVINNSSETRIVISWSVLKPMTFQECLVSMSKMV